jgi:hypothetical protein
LFGCSSLPSFVNSNSCVGRPWDVDRRVSQTSIDDGAADLESPTAVPGTEATSKHIRNNSGSSNDATSTNAVAQSPPAKIGQLQKRIFPLVFLPLSLVLLALSADPLGVNGIYPQ